MLVHTVFLGDHQIQNQHVPHHRRNVGGLRNADDHGLDPSFRIVVDEERVGGLQANPCVVMHVDRHARNAQVFLRGEQRVDLDVPRHVRVEPVDEDLHVLPVDAVGYDGKLRPLGLPLRHLKVNFVGGNAIEQSEIVKQVDLTCRQGWQP